MNVRDKILINPFQVLAMGLGTALLAISNPLAAQDTPSIAIDGSSTVYPITLCTGQKIRRRVAKLCRKGVP